MVILTREMFEQHGWEPHNFEIDGQHYWCVTLSRRFEDGDNYYAELRVTNIMCDERFALQGDLTGDLKISHIMLHTVDDYNNLMKLAHIDKLEPALMILEE